MSCGTVYAWRDVEGVSKCLGSCLRGVANGDNALETA